MADAGFLAAIAAAPRNGLARLVYADFLDERADPRGDYLRQLCAAAGWTECPDRAGAVARLQAVRAQFDADWLSTVQRGVPWKLLFEANLPPAPPRRGWYEFGPPATAGKIAEAEAALGYRLPHDLRELVAEFNGAQWWWDWNYGRCPVRITEFLDLPGLVLMGEDFGSRPGWPLFFVADDIFCPVFGLCLADTDEFRAGEVVCWHGYPPELRASYPSLFECVRRYPALVSTAASARQQE